MGALSLDLRERIVSVLQNDPMATYPQIAARFSVSTSTVERLWRKVRDGQSLTPKPHPGRAPKVTPEQQATFDALAASRTDWTLRSLAAAWQEQTGVMLSQATVSRTLTRIRFSHKKSATLLSNETKASASGSASK